jgi:hypothetical protein
MRRMVDWHLRQHHSHHSQAPECFTGEVQFDWKVSKESSQMKNRFFFSQEMASSSSHNNNGIPLATLLEWYKIRDTFFGHNLFLRTSLWHLSLPRLASIQTLVGSLRLALERT